MSYILDALKRAEAERRGARPQRAELPAAFVAAPATPPIRRLLPWLAGLVGLAALAALATLALGLRASPASQPLPPVAASPQPAAVPPPPAPPPARPAVIIPPQAAAAPLSAPLPAPVVPRPAPVSARPALGTLRDLPPQVQREIPPLVIGGYLYSPNPADRSVLVNNRLRHEGDEIEPGLTLEALRPDGMVLNYRGHRYRSRY